MPVKLLWFGRTERVSPGTPLLPSFLLSYSSRCLSIRNISLDEAVGFTYFPHSAIPQVLRTQRWKGSSGTGSLCCVTNHPKTKQLKTVAVLCSQNLWIGKFGPGTVGLAEALAGKVPTAERFIAYFDGVCRVCRPNHVTPFGLTSPTSVLFRRDHFDDNEDSDPVPGTCDFLYTVRLGCLCTPHVTSKP